MSKKQILAYYEQLDTLAKSINKQQDDFHEIQEKLNALLLKEHKKSSKTSRP